MAGTSPATGFCDRLGVARDAFQKRGTPVNLFDLSGKVAIVTGSSRGIGRAIAEMFAEAGAKVTISARNQAPCDEVVEAIRAKGGEAMAVPPPISDQGQLENLSAKTAPE